MRFALTVAATLITAVTCTVPARGEEIPLQLVSSMSRDQIRSLPIEARPNRPIHFYGNAVRRRHHRATTPAPAAVRPAR